ncbi:MAG: M56 family metallopeptidase [Lachnospiraceae bacterium]|nr:M56 family metallopeptidase [Lachnospiraceae bacterium]
MSAVFLKILNLTWSASWLILAVTVARPLLKKAPRWVTCLLWGLVAIRLICPVSIESALSLLPSAKVVPETVDVQPRIDTGITVINNAVNPAVSVAYASAEETGVNTMQTLVSAASIIWITGVALMFLYALISYITIRRKVGASVRLKDNIMICDEVRTPFILGLVRPLIYVPSALEGERMELVCAHEKAHISRHDHWWKPLGFALLSVYWFNPLCWLAYILLCRDIEAACDEKVIKDKDREYMAAYSQALLDLSISGKVITACPLAFGETGVKSRIKGILNYKKPAFWIIIIALAACVIVAVCFLTNPKKDEADDINALENMDVNYTYENGVYVVDSDGNRKTYQYKKELRGRSPGAAHDGMYIVLTDNADITFEMVSRSMYSSDSRDWLDDTKIIGIHALDDNGEIIVFDEEKMEYYDYLCEQLTDTINSAPGMPQVYVSWREKDEDRVEILCFPQEYYTKISKEKYDSLKALLEASAGDDTSIIIEDFMVEGLEPDTQDIPAAGIATDPELWQPPVVTVIYAGNVYATTQGSFNWSYVDEKGVGHGGSAECGHPLDTVDTMSHVDLQKNTDTVGIHLDHAPKKMSCRYWDSESAGKSDAYDKNFKEILSLPEGGGGVIDDYMKIPTDTPLVFELYGEWENGTSSYYFAILPTGTQIGDWIALNLPGGYNLSIYSDYNGYYGGSYILPQAYTAVNKSSVPASWLYSGVITRLPASNVQLTFTDQHIPYFDKDSHFYMDNHTVQEYIKTIVPENRIDGWYALEFSEEHDLYTPADIEELEKQGLTIGEDERSSSYWVFWYVKEDADTYYMLSLAKNKFTQEQAEDIAVAATILK